MVYFAVADEEPDSFVKVEYVYDNNKNNPDKNPNIVFDFTVFCTRAPVEYSDGEEDTDYANLDTLTVCETHEIPRELLYGSDMDTQDCRNNIGYLLEYIDVPRYRTIVNSLTRTVLDLKNREASCVLPRVERVKVVLDVMVRRFPGEEEEEEEELDVDYVRLAVAPASEEAVEAHLETVVVENDEGCCVICMDEIMVESDLEVVRMPCKHLFHRNCGEQWLRNSGICPVCRAVFPSES